MVPPNLQKTVLQNNTSGLYDYSHPIQEDFNICHEEVM